MRIGIERGEARVRRPPLARTLHRDVARADRGGPVGARIVTEVFLGLLQGDKGSYLAQDPEWQPFLPTVDASKTGDDFKMIDLLRYAKVA